MEENAKYRISLEDFFSKVLGTAESHANHFENTIGKIHSGLKGLAAAGIASFGIMGVTSLVKESLAKYDEYSKAQAQIESSLVSTKNAAGITKSELSGIADEMSKVSLASKTEIANTEALLLTFTSVKKNIFAESMEAIEDMSTKMHQEMSQTAIQVGIALNDPIHGMTRLHRVGVQFSEEQKKQIHHFQESGKLLEAQEIILKELQTEFGGSGAAAANAGLGPIQMMMKQIGAIKRELGESIAKTFIEHKQDIQDFIESLKSAGHWLKENWTLIKNIGEMAGAMFVAWKAASLVSGMYELATATTFALGPIGLITAGIVAIGAAWAYSSSKWEEYNDLGKKAQEGHQKRLEAEAKVTEDKYIKAAAFNEKTTIDKKADAEILRHENEIKELEWEMGRVRDPSSAVGKAETEGIKNRKEIALAQIQAAKDLKAATRKGKSTSSAPSDLGSGLKDATGQKITNVVFNFNKEFVNLTQNIERSVTEGTQEIKTKMLEAFASVANDFAILPGSNQ